MTRTFSFILASLLGLALTPGCAKDTGTVPQWPWTEPEPEIPDKPTEPEFPLLPETPHTAFVNPTEAGWTDVTADYPGLRSGISIYRFTDKFFGRPAIAYIAVADASAAGFSIWSINAPELQGSDDAFKTPSKVYEASSSSVIVNGGFFYSSDGKNYSASVAVSEGNVLGMNVNYASEDWKTIYYPTRAAFIEHSDGSYETCWTYWTSAGKHFTYQIPAPNSWKKKPEKVPSATFPENAVEFEAKNAIGGGPVLLKNSKIIDSYVEELFNGKSGIGPDVYAPRTAVGISADSKLLLFVCEGREMTEGVKGLTTGEVAKVLYSLGIKDAINLDGGGSSCMLIGGKETIKLSDGRQRAVASTVMFK